MAKGAGRTEFGGTGVVGREPWPSRLRGIGVDGREGRASTELNLDDGSGRVEVVAEKSILLMAMTPFH